MSASGPNDDHDLPPLEPASACPNAQPLEIPIRCTHETPQGSAHMSSIEGTLVTPLMITGTLLLLTYAHESPIEDTPSNPIETTGTKVIQRYLRIVGNFLRCDLLPGILKVQAWCSRTLTSGSA